jgi:hypothetical protein
MGRPRTHQIVRGIPICRWGLSLPSGAKAWLARGCVHAPRPSVPPVRILRETRTLHPHDAEPLSSRGWHHHPALQAVHDVRTQVLLTRYLGRDIIGLDVQVDAAFMVDTLNLHSEFVRRGLQHPIVAAAAPMIEAHGTTERLCLEASGLVHMCGPRPRPPGFPCRA